MTPTLSNTVCGCALAIFCEGTILYENPLYRACFGEGFSPAPVAEGSEATFFTRPFPHLAAHAPLLQEKKVYSLFAALPFAEGEAQEPLLLRFAGIVSDVQALFARAAQRPPLQTISMEMLSHTVRRLVEEELSLPFHLSGDIPETDQYTRVDLRGLLMALGILLPPMLADGDLGVSLQHLQDGWQMLWRGGKPPALPFLRRLAAHLCETGGISMDLSEDGFSLFFPAHRPKVLSLRSPGAGDIRSCLRLGLYLGE